MRFDGCLQTLVFVFILVKGVSVGRWRKELDKSWTLDDNAAQVDRHSLPSMPLGIPSLAGLDVAASLPEPSP